MKGHVSIDHGSIRPATVLVKCWEGGGPIAGLLLDGGLCSDAAARDGDTADVFLPGGRWRMGTLAKLGQLWVLTGLLKALEVLR